MGLRRKRTLEAIDADISTLQANIEQWNARRAEIERITAEALDKPNIRLGHEYNALTLKLAAAPTRLDALQDERRRASYESAKADWNDALKALQDAQQHERAAREEIRIKEVELAAYKAAYTEHLQPPVLNRVSRAKTRIAALLKQMEQSGYAAAGELAALRAESERGAGAVSIEELDALKRQLIERYRAHYLERFGIEDIDNNAGWLQFLAEQGIRLPFNDSRIYVPDDPRKFTLKG